MARIRTVKPEFWTDERVGECSPTARLLFIACWSFSDDHGGLDRSAKQLKAQAFPHDHAIDCEALIQELMTAELLTEYAVDGKKYLHINGFRKHQKVEKPSAPRCPLFREYSPSARRMVAEASGISPGLVAVSSSEGKGKGSKTPPTPSIVGEGSPSSNGNDPNPGVGVETVFDPKTVAGLNVEAWERFVRYRAGSSWGPVNSTAMAAAAQMYAQWSDLEQRTALMQAEAEGWKRPLIDQARRLIESDRKSQPKGAPRRDGLTGAPGQ